MTGVKTMKAASSGDKELLKIGDLADESGKSVRTLHYYEELGLLRPAVRSRGGFRLYRESDVRRVLAISALQSLDMPLKRVREVVAAWDGARSGRDVSSALRALFQSELEETTRKIESLKEMQSALGSALSFLEDCAGCADEPTRGVCSDCCQSGHEHDIPDLIAAFLPEAAAEPGKESAAHEDDGHDSATTVRREDAPTEEVKLG